MSKTFIVKLRTGSITGPVVANSQVITADIVGDGAIDGADFADGLLTGTITSNAAGAVSFVKQLTGPTYAITPTNVTANEGEAVTFTIMTTGVNTGTNLYWKMEGLGPIDYVTGDPGSFQTLSNNTVAFDMVNSVTNMRGGDYAHVVNWLYLRYLGRWPENAGVVDTFVPSLLDGTLSIPQLEANIAGSQEVQNQAALPVGVVQVAANGNAVISGTVINDQRTEPKEFSNLIILTGSLNGTEVARTKFDIENTNNGQLLTFNTPISITEGTNANVTLFSLGGQFINSNVVVTLANVLDSGPNAIIGTDVTLNGGISTNVFISTSNAFIYTFNIAAPSGGVSEGSAYFLLRAFTEGGALITSSANIRVVSATYTTFASEVTPQEGNVLIFTISDTQLSQGTTLYWSMPDQGPTDFVVGNIGSYRSVTDANVISAENPDTKINGSQYGEIINRLYLRYFGRYPDDSNLVNSIAGNLVNQTTTIEDFEATFYASPEYQNLPAFPSGNVLVQANGNAVLTGTVIRDSRPEGNKAANLVVRINSANGPEVARQPFTIIDTDPGLLIAYGTPVSLSEGQTRQFSLVSIGGQFLNTNVVVRVTETEDAGPNALPGTDITLNGNSSVNVFITTTNVQIQTINLTAVSDGVGPEVNEYFLLRAFTETGQLITSTANILIDSN